MCFSDQLNLLNTVFCSTCLCSGNWLCYQPTPDFPWILRQKTQTYIVWFNLPSGKIAGCYYLSPGKACPYTFLISVSPTCHILQLLKSPDQIGYLLEWPMWPLFWDLTWLPSSLFLNHGNSFFYLKSLFSYSDPEVPPVPSSMGLFTNRSRANCWIGS